MFIMYLIITSVPILDFVLFKGELSHNPNFQFFISSSYIIYPFAGYFIENRLDEKYFRSDIGFLMIGISAMTICLTSRLCDWKANLTNPLAVSSYNSFFMNYAVIISITLHYCLKVLFMKISVPGKVGKLITTAAGATFFVYLFENIWRYVCLPVYDFLCGTMNPYIACMLYILAAMMLGEIIGIAYYFVKGKILNYIEWNA